ncbi:MAG: protein kinase, partial [Acidimicrobiales bacterium]
MRTVAEKHSGIVLQGRYRLKTELGTGSSARVYLADDTRLHRPVAVKLLHPALSRDETFVRRFRLEARAAASLNHPNIVHVYDWGSDEEGFYVVLEYLAGGTLRDLLARRGTISIAQAASIGLSIAQALAFAHERGIVHRDIKPANLLFDESATPHLADFGLAKALAEASWTEPNGLVLGTARYASPEQALGQHLDDRSDVYSLGLVLYEAITGWSPFAGDSLHSLLVARVGNELPKTPELGPLESVIAAATCPDRTARLSAAELVERLDRSQRELLDPEPILLSPRVDPEADFEDDVEDADRRSATSSAPAEATILDRPSAVGRARVRPQGGSRHPNRRRRRATRRVQLLIAGVSVVVLVLGGAFAIARFVVFSHVIPNVVHDQLTAARHDVSGRGLRIQVTSRVYSSTISSGVVTTEFPRPGTRERAGVTVDVVVSRGPEMVLVPRLVGDTKT